MTRGLLAATLVVVLLAGVGCGEAHHSGHGAAAAAASPETLADGREPSEAQVEARRRAQMRKSEAIEAQEIAAKRAEAEKIQRTAAAAAATAKARAAKAQASKDKTSRNRPSHTHTTGGNASKVKPVKPETASGGENAADRAARKRFAAEEAQEAAAYRKRERQEAVGK